MRVLFWSDSLAPFIGGIETYAGHLLPRLRARGVEVLALTSQRGRVLPEHDCIDGVDVVRIDLPPIAPATRHDDVVRTRRRVADVKRTFRADVYHLNLWGAAPMWHGVTTDAHPAAVLTTVHGPLHPAPGHAIPAVQRLMRQADWINTVSQAGLDHVLQQVPEYSERSSIIPLGLPDSGLPASPLPAVPQVAWCGRLVEGKGLDLALEAFRIVATQCPDVRFLIVGHGPDRAASEHIVARLGLADRVTFSGIVPSVPHAMNEASMLVMSSRTEGFGYVVLEAALQARPTVAPRVEGLVEAIADGDSGLLVEPSSPALAEGVLRLLREPGLLGAMGARARRRALADFGIDRMVDRYVALYERLASGRWPGPPLGDQARVES